MDHIDNLEPTTAIQPTPSPLLLIPAELITEIYCQLDSFLEGFALASTCHHMKCVWTENVNQIYEQFGPVVIPLERHARSFRQIQSGAATHSLSVSTQDVLSLLRNRKIIEKAIVQFETNVVSKASCKSLQFKFRARV
jgi:hypothetical protein